MKYFVSFFNTDKKYDVYPSNKLSKELSNQLDMCEFTLTGINFEFNFDFEKYNGLIPIVLYKEQDVLGYFYLSYYKRMNVSYNPVRYNYLIQATSCNLKLQRIDLPNKLITQPLLDEKRTVWQEFNKIMEVYAPDIIIDERLESMLNITCPELQFVKSTLYEVLVDLFSIANIVPHMTDFNNLSYLDLRGNGREWSSSNLIRIEETNSISEYADMLDYDIENAIAVDKKVNTQWLAPTSEEPLITTENFIWKLPSNIYDIIKVEVLTQVYYRKGSETDYVEITRTWPIDITNYIVSKEVWETLKVSSKIDAGVGDYKRNYLYYDTNKIVGNFSESAWIGETDKSIKNAIRLALIDEDSSIEMVHINFPISFDYRDILMRVTYLTENDNSRVRIIKKNIKKPINSMISNQENSYIDIVNFGKQKQEMINRLGNKVILGQANFDLEEIEITDYPKLGDIIDNDYVITKMEMLYNEFNLLVNYTLTKDYVLQTGFSGLNQVKRFTSIDTKTTVIRNDNFLFNFQLDFNNKNSNNYLIKKILNNYGKANETGISLHLIELFTPNNARIPERIEGNDLQNYYLITSQNKQIADSILCQFGFETNFKLGDKITIDEGVTDFGDAYINEPVRYVDDNGEFRTINIYFGEGEYYRNIENLGIIQKYPLVEYVIDEQLGNNNFNEFLINKDNREITNITMQLRVVGKQDEIIVYDNFLKHSNILNTTNQDFKIYVKKYDYIDDFEKNKYKNNTIYPVGGQKLDANIEFYSSNNTINVTNVCEVDTNGFLVIGILDNDNNLILGINCDARILTQGTDVVLYLNEIK